MSQWSTFTELTRADSQAEMVFAYRGKNYRRDIRNMYLETFLSRFSGAGYRDDFWNANRYRYPWHMNVIGAGVLATIGADVDNPGIVRITQNGANTGGYLWTNYASSILIAGQEITELIFRLQSVAAGVVLRFGFGDNFSAAAAPTDGIYISIAGATVSGKTRNNSAESTTASTYAASAATWYRAKIVVNDDASRVDFYLYDAAGAQLWTDNLTTNIPKTAGRELSHGVHAYKTSVGVVDIVDLDFINLRLPKALTR